MYIIATPGQKSTVVNVWNTLVSQLHIEYGLDISDCLVSQTCNSKGEFSLCGAEWLIKAGKIEVGQLFYKEGKFSIHSFLNSENKKILSFKIQDLIGNEEGLAQYFA